MQKKTNFENESGNAILESASKLNKIVSYDDKIVSQKFVSNQAFSFVPRLDFALRFSSVNNYSLMLTSELDFAFL